MIFLSEVVKSLNALWD